MPIPLSTKVNLPDDVATSTMAIIGQKGSGKTYCGNVLAEGMADLGVPIVVIDPTDVWWGLRTSADGKGKGLGIAIVGGDHGDIPVQPGMGAKLGRLVAHEGLSCILSRGRLTQIQWNRLLLEFFTTLYSENREPLHLLIDEADSVAPQKARSGVQQELHDIVDDIVRRGRVKGLGTTLITQRPAVIAKNVLSQIDVLTVMHLTAPQDKKAIEAWLAGHDIEGLTATVIESLPTLEPGEGWLWSPQHDLFEKIKVRKRRTFDSSFTPKVGEQRKVAQSFADVDAAAFRSLLAPEDAPDESPADRAAVDVSRDLKRENGNLRRRVKALEEKLAKAIPRVTVENVLRSLNLAKAAFGELGDELSRALETDLQPEANVLPPSLETPPVAAAAAAASPAGKQKKPKAATKPASAPRAADVVRNGSGLTPSKLRILRGIRWWSVVGIKDPSRRQVAFTSAYSPKTSGFEKNISTLHTEGYLHYPRPGLLELTDAGVVAAGEPPVGAGDEATLHRLVKDALKPAQWRVLEPLLKERGASVTRADLASASDYSIKTSGFEKTISTLHTLGLVEYPRQGEVAAAALLFIA